MQGGVLTYTNLFGPVLGIVVDKHQWWVEKAACPHYETAIPITKSAVGEIFMYPQEKGMVLKLVVDGKCTRQVQTGINAQGSADHDSISLGLKKLGFELSGTKALMTYFKALQSKSVDGPIVRMQDANGKICQFQILGGFLKPNETTVTMKYDEVFCSGKLEDVLLRNQADPFKTFVSCTAE